MGKRTNTAVWDEKRKRWQINVQSDVKRRSFYSSTPGRTGQRECNKKADNWLDDGISENRIRASVLYDRWLDELKATTGRGHWSLYDGYWKNWISSEIGHVRVGDITEQHLQNVIVAAHKSGLAKKTLSNIRACMAAFIKYARKNKQTNLIVENVAIPRNAKQKEHVILQPTDIIKLFNIDNTVMRNKKIYDLYVNAYRFEVITGLRPGEVIGLQWCDIDGNLVHLKRSINKFNEETRGKNDNARRTFELIPFAQHILQNQCKKLQELSIESEYVFPNEMGEHIKQRTYHGRWVTYRDAVGITKATPYELRHTFVSVVKSMPEGLLKMLVGHSKDMDTYGTYSHEVDGDISSAAGYVQEAFLRILHAN